ncbi:DUF1549 domain-containing protein [bacterium]|nr:DUF1549 domain-containing protein [bacterium]
MKSCSNIILVAFGIGVVLSPISAAEATEAEILFATQVQPLLVEKCLACHGDKADDIQGGLDLRALSSTLKGGESGEAAIVPQHPEQSSLFRAVTWDDEALQMPPKENDRLTSEQVALVKRWIEAGAAWPNDERIQEIQKSSDKWTTAAGIQVVTSGGLSETWTNRRYDPANLWAYQPLWKAESGGQKAESPSIDAAIEHRLANAGLAAAPTANRRTLIRRVTFDLIGLPPTPAEIDAFVDDPAEDDIAWAMVIDRLLASPHYGEQMARHWLDVVRYADSSGFANDYERGNAWRYRDYVIRAFNHDKPYDQFIIEQLAGDEVVEARQKDEGGRRNEDSDSTNPSLPPSSFNLHPSNSELLIATGFLRMGPWELTGMEVAKVARQRFLDDVTDAVGQVFLGHMLQCARCHDHKFDPVPTRDYYSIQAAFATTQLVEREAEFLPEENVSGFEERKYLDQRREFYDRVLAQLDLKQTLEAARAWFRETGKDSSAFERIIQQLANRSKPAEAISLAMVRQAMQKQKIDPELIPPKHTGFAPQDFGMERVARKGLERLKWRYDRYEPFALSVYSGRTPEMKAVYNPLRMPENRMQAGELEQTCILAGGDPFAPSTPVSPGVLSAVANKEEGRRMKEENATAASLIPPTSFNPHPFQITGRRLALAGWIASSDNPLTARVMVNRIWQWHFGRAIAGNPNNFGATGKKPTHPEPLDDLARSFITNQWSIKQLHRQILMTQVYRRSTQHPQPELVAERDPLGELYATFQPRRLTAEELRDAMLFVSGELNLEMGGIPVRPEMNLEAALQPRMVMGTFAEAWQPSPLPSQRHRRSIYALKLRGQRDPFQEVFNSPTPDLSCEAREASTVTPQVFALFNSEATLDWAVALSRELGDESPVPEKEVTIQRLFLKLLGRKPSSVEVSATLAHWEKMTERHRSLQFASSLTPREVLREAVEENTGEKFSFTEPLEAYADFVPDKKLSDLSPELRGLAEVCLVLLNSNEFAYIY